MKITLKKTDKYFFISFLNLLWKSSHLRIIFVLFGFSFCGDIFNCPIFSDNSLPSIFNLFFKSFQYFLGCERSLNIATTSTTLKYYFSFYISKSFFFCFLISTSDSWFSIFFCIKSSISSSMFSSSTWLTIFSFLL